MISSSRTFGSDGADATLGRSRSLLRLDWCLDDLDAFACEDGIKGAGELAVAVADQEAKRRSPLLERPSKGGLLADPKPVGFRASGRSPTESMHATR